MLKYIIGSAHDLYHLTGTVRYNNQFMLKQENVAEHSYMVSAIAHMICEQYKVDPLIHLEVLKYAIVHDIPESVTGDILASTKANIPGLSEMLSEYELKVVSDNFPYLIKAYREYHEKTYQLAYNVLKLADYISVEICMKREKMLGNKSSFIDIILYDVEKKINSFYEKVMNDLK